MKNRLWIEIIVLVALLGASYLLGKQTAPKIEVLATPMATTIATAMPSITPTSKPQVSLKTPSPTVKAVTISNCNDSKIASFRATAASQGFSEEEINSLVDSMVRAGCPVTKSNTTTNSKINKIDMCLSYGVCY